MFDYAFYQLMEFDKSETTKPVSHGVYDEGVGWTESSILWEGINGQYGPTLPRTPVV